MEQQNQQPLQQEPSVNKGFQQPKKSFVRKKRFWAIVGMSLVLIAVGAYFATTLFLHSVPVIQLKYEGNVYKGQQGSGCWPELGSTLCWDTVFPNPEGTIVVSQGDKLHVAVSAYKKPEEVSALIFTADDQRHVQTITISPSKDSEFQIDLPPNTYIVSIFASWPIGDVSYGFKVAVEGLGIDTSTWQTYRNEEF